MQLVLQGMSDEEAVENAIKTLEFGKKKVAEGMSDVCVLKSNYDDKLIICYNNILLREKLFVMK